VILPAFYLWFYVRNDRINIYCFRRREMKKRGMRKILFTIACVMLFAIAGGRQVFAQGESLTLQEI